MGFLVLLKFAVKCFDILAWPLFALVYPLCASIWAIELDSNSDIRKLVTYWVLFSLISLFDHAFARLLEWLPFWPYVKLMAIFWFVVPHFDGSFYVYKNLVRPCFSVNLRVFIELCNKWKEYFLNRENFLVVAERYVEENGPEALERLIASKCTKPNVDVEEIKAVAVTEEKEVNLLKCKEPKVAQKETKAVEVTEKKEAAATEWCTKPGVDVKEIKVVAATEKKKVDQSKCKEPNVAQKEPKAVEVTEKKEVTAAEWVNRTAPNPAQTENRTFAAAGTKETTTAAAATAGSDSKLPEIPASKKVQKEWTCALCQVTTQSEKVLNSHLQGKKHTAKIVCTKPNVDVEEIKAVAVTEKKEVDLLKCKEPKVAQKETKAVEVTEKKEAAAAEWCAKPGVDVKEIKAVAATEKTKVDQIKCKEPDVAQKEPKAVEVTEKKEAAAAEWCTKPGVDVKEIKVVAATEKKKVDQIKCKEPNFAQKEPKAVEVTKKKEVAAAEWVNQTAPNLAHTENRTFAASGTKETATTAGSDSKLPEIPASKKVQKEWTCALCQVTTQSETLLNSHLQGKKHTAKLKELEVKNQAAKNKGSPAPTAVKSDQPKVETKTCVSGNGSNQKNTGKQEEKVDVSPIKQWCSICNIICPGAPQMDSHLKGRKHLAQIRY